MRDTLESRQLAPTANGSLKKIATANSLTGCNPQFKRPSLHAYVAHVPNTLFRYAPRLLVRCPKSKARTTRPAAPPRTQNNKKGTLNAKRLCLTSQTCADPFLGNLASDSLATLEPLGYRSGAGCPLRTPPPPPPPPAKKSSNTLPNPPPPPPPGSCRIQRQRRTSKQKSNINM